MNIVDSSGWIECFKDGEHAKHFAEVLADTDNLLVPSIILFEVFRKLLTEVGETEAINFTAQMRQGKIVELNEYTSVLSAKIAKEMGLAMADGIIYAIAWLNNATIYTCDADFKGLANVKYFKKS